MATDFHSEGTAVERILAGRGGKHSRPEMAPHVGDPDNPKRYDPVPTGNNGRDVDTGYLTLTYIANKLGPPSSNIKGAVTMHSSRAACSSCTPVIGQLLEDFPNIVINYTSGRP
ncbi:deaminase domain-containing protein [Streptomyces sp. NPDC055632]